VVFGVHFGGMRMMLRRMQRVTMRDLGMMGGLFRTAGLMVLRGLAMMLGRVLVMLSLGSA
jgi:hypothetical protein